MKVSQSLSVGPGMRSISMRGFSSPLLSDLSPGGSSRCQSITEMTR